MENSGFYSRCYLFFCKEKPMSFSLSGTLSKHFIRYNVQFSFFFLNKGERNLLKKKLIFLSIDFDSLFSSRGRMSINVHDKKRNTVRENGHKGRAVSIFFSSFFFSSCKNEKLNKRKKELWPGSLRFFKFSAWRRKQNDKK